MSAGAQIDWSKYEEQPKSTVPQIDFSKYESEQTPPKQYLPGRDIGMRVAKGMGFDADALKEAEDRGGEKEAWSELGRQFLEGLKGMALDPLSPISQSATNFEEAVKSRDWAQIAGAASTILGGAESTRTGLEATSAGTRLGREAVGGAIHTPEGALTPGAETVGRVAGGAIGAGAGSLVGHEYLGAAAGYKLGPSLMEQLFPEPKDIIEKRAQDARYKALGEELERRGKQQETLDRKAAIQQARQTKLDALKAKQQAAQAPPPSLFPGAQATSPQATAGLPSQALPQGTATPFPGPKPAQFVSKFAAPETPESRIVSPESTPPDVKVTYQSVPQKELLSKVKAGDKFAITEWQRRGLPLPPNVRYLSELAGTKPWRAYSE
jgi:hypothetical protein